MRQTIIGKAFEYAVVDAIYQALEANQPVVVEKTAALETARSFYMEIPSTNKEKLSKSAVEAIRNILRLEPQLENPSDNCPLYLSIQSDAEGQKGDVRDVLAMRRQNNWEIGISCKHNHDAVKHSRLSDKLDFGKMWFDHPCSDTYFNEIDPVFSRLRQLKESNMNWSNVSEKNNTVYYPVLQAFMNELLRLSAIHQDIPKRLVQYLLGQKDFYKVISNDKRRYTTIQAFNLYGTLNQSSGGTQPQNRAHMLRLPSMIYQVYFKQDSTNTIIVACDQGWEIHMRIHNASSRVEPSLKFDVKLNGIPAAMYSHDEYWE